MDRTRIKILVVDDERGLAAGIQEALQREGYTVDAAHDAASALQLAQQHLYNLILSDIRMPGLSGLDLLKQIRERSRDTLFLLMITASIYVLVRWARADEGPWAQVRIASVGAILPPVPAIFDPIPIARVGERWRRRREQGRERA